MLFGIIGGEVTMFPDARKILEFVGCHLVIGRVGGLLFVVQNGWTADRASARAKDPFRILLLGPPEPLIEPMHAPIAQRAIRVIQKAAPAARVHFRIERPHRRRTAPLVPIHVLWRFAVWLRLLMPAAAVRKKPHHSDIPHRA